MIIDSFIYYNEADVVDIRINELKDVVDKVIIFSAMTTYRGNSNPNMLPEHLYEINDIEFHRVDFPKRLKFWEAEK